MPGEVTEFRVEIGPDAIADLRDRLARTRWPEARDRRRLVAGHPARVRAGAVRLLGATATTGAAAEARLNAFPQFRTEIDGLGIHFLHVRSPHADALPLVHHPRLAGFGRRVPQGHRAADRSRPRTAATRADAFHVVCPSLPGYGFSDKPTRAGLERRSASRRRGPSSWPASATTATARRAATGARCVTTSIGQQRPRARRRHPPQHADRVPPTRR